MKKMIQSQLKRKKLFCEKCGGTSFKSLIATYPLDLMDRQIMVQRVSVKKCLDCGTLLPTQKGKEKLARCLDAYLSLPF